MKKLLSILLPVVLMASFSPDASAVWLSGASSIPQEFIPESDIIVEKLSNSSCIITINIPGLESVLNNFGNELVFPGNSPSGRAETVSSFLVYPQNSICEVQILDYEYQSHQVNITLAQLPGFSSSLVPLTECESGAVSIGDPGIMRGVSLIPINFKPFIIESDGDIVNVTSVIRIQVTFTGGVPPVALSPGFSELIDEISWNYSPAPSDEFIPSSYIVIAPDEFTTEVQPFVDWKNQKGLRTDLVKFSDIGATSTNESIIKDYLTTLYQSSDAPEYVLLVGDESQFPVHYVYTPDPTTPFSSYSYPGYYTNDNYFACLEGEDYLPDVFLGRFVASNTTEVMKLANKIISYEKYPNMLELDWYDRGMVCSDLTEPTQRTTKLQIRDWMLEDGGFTVVDTIFGQGYISSFFTNVNSGRSFINYRGTGWDIGWSGIAVYAPNLSALTNVFKFPIVTGIGCGVAKFDGSNECFGEVWMNAGTYNNPMGAAAFIGPTWNTHTYYNDALDEGIYSAFIHDSVRTVSPALLAGKMHVQAEFGPYIPVYESVEEIVRTLFGQYIIFSDPELSARASIPRTLNVTRTDSIFLGTSTVDVAVTDESGVPVEGLQVALYSQTEDEIYVDQTAANGEISFDVDLEVMPNNFYITVTGIDVNTHIDSILVYANDAYVAHYEYDFIENPPGDGLLAPGEEIILSERAKNFGAQAAHNVSGIITCEYPGTVVTQDSAHFGDMVAGGSEWGDEDYLFTAPQEIDEEYLVIDLNIRADEGDWTSSIYFEVHQPNIILEFTTLDPGPTSILERGGEAFIEVTITNNGNLPAANLTGTLTSLDPEAVIVDGEFLFDSLYVNETRDNEEDPFVFVVSGLCPYDFPAHFNLQISGGQGTFYYERDFQFEYEICDPSSYDPSPDVQNIYYGYESRDINYAQSPDFDWVEISPALGGPGTIILWGD